MVKRFNRIRDAFISIVVPSTAFTLTGAVSVLVSSNEQNVNDRSIPINYLDMSSDQTILNGLAKGVSKEDIANYNTLTIPDTVITIAPHAFWFMFDGASNNISKIVFNKSLQTIGDGAFYCCYGIKTINFESIQDDSELKYIGKEAFSDTEIGPSLYIPKKVEKIGERCFANCQFIDDTLSIPNSVKDIGKYAFMDSAYINEIDITSWVEIPKFMYENRMIFSNVGTGEQVHAHTRRTVNVAGIISDDLWEDILFTRQLLTSFDDEYTGFLLNVNRPVKTVPEDAFEYPEIEDPEHEGKKWKCIKFKSSFDLSTLKEYTDIVIGNDVNCIDDEAFKDKIKNCHLNIKFPASLKMIRERAFENCSGLYGQIQLPDSVREVWSWAFNGCSNIDTVIMGKGLEKLGLTGSDKGRTFRNCYSLKNIVFGGHTTMKMGPLIFENDHNVTDVDWTAFGSIGFPDEWWVDPPIEKGNDEVIKAINAFKGFPKTGRIYVDETFFPYDDQIKFIKNTDTGMGLTTFNENAGYDDSDYWTCVSPRSYTNPFGDHLFLTDTNISTVWTMQQDGIENKTLYDLIAIPHTISKIADNAFANIFSVTQVQKTNYYWALLLNEGLISIGNRAFQNCINITYKLNLPSTLEWIGDFAFADCAHLIGLLEIPKSVSHIGTQAFAGCNLLSNHTLSLPANLSYIGNFAFEGTRIESIKFNSTLPCTFVGSPFYGMNDLTKLDLTSLSLDDVKEKWQTSQQTFWFSQPSGQIIVNEDEDPTAWTQWMLSHGLPEDWKVQQSTYYNDEQQNVGGNYE